MSISTGPGRPLRAMWNASLKMRGMSSARSTSHECFTIGMVMPWMSASWKASVPIRWVGTWPVMHNDRRGVEVGVGDRRDQVGGARAGGGDATPTLPVARA